MEPSAKYEELKIPLREPVQGLEEVSGVLGIPEWWPTGQRVGVVLAHAANNNFNDPLLVALQRILTDQKLLTLRFNFPFAEAEKRQPNSAEILVQTYRAAVTVLGRDSTNAPAYLFLGGRGIGGQTAGQLSAARARIDGVFYLGYPLHTAGKPEKMSADDLFRVIAPMLFIQGNRDRQCDIPLLNRTLLGVGAPTSVHIVDDADGMFNVTKKSGRSDEEVLEEISKTLQDWISSVLNS